MVEVEVHKSCLGDLPVVEGKPLIVAAVPAYNEENTIARVVLMAKRYVDRVLVCDDGSKDLTALVAEELGADVIRSGKNSGKGMALKTLFERATELGADVVVTLDADGQHDPGEIPHLVKPVLNGDADIVVGSRFLTGNNEMPFYRRLGCKVLNGLVNMFGEEKIADTQSGFRAYNRKALEEIDITTDGIGVDSEILMKVYGNGVKIKEVPISCRYKGVDGSTYNPVRHWVDVVGSIIRYASERKPLLTFGLPGAMVLAVGMMLFVYVLQIYFSTKQFAMGYILTSMIAILLGVFAIFTALILYTMSNLMQKNKRS